MSTVVRGLQLAAAAVAPGNSGAPVLVTQGYEDVLRHTTIIEQTFEKIKQASGRCEWAPTAREGGTRTPIRLPVSHIAGSDGEDAIGGVGADVASGPGFRHRREELAMAPRCLPVSSTDSGIGMFDCLTATFGRATRITVGRF